MLRAAEEVEEVQEEPHQGQSDSENTAECELCQMVAGTLDVILKENKTEVSQSVRRTVGRTDR